jgi:hypothetical protein
MSDPRHIEIGFEDGKLTCWGRINFDGEFQSVEGDGVWERTKKIHIDIISHGILTTVHEESELEPGAYVVTSEGLFRRVEA